MKKYLVNFPCRHPFVKYVLLVIIAASCVTKKQITYLQSPDKIIPGYAQYSPETYQIKTGDELYINVEPLVEEEQGFLNSSNKLSSGTLAGRTLSLMSYLVYEDGTIDFPYVGKIKVAGKTTRQVREQIMNILDEYLREEAKITVKLVNRYVSIIGEVRSPGRFEIYEERLNIFQALSMAGDITSFGSRKNVKIIRHIGDSIAIKEFDIRSEELLGSEFYFIEPNDVIYVEKIRGQFFRFDNFGSFFSTVTSSLSFLILVLNYSEYFKKSN